MSTVEARERMRQAVLVRDKSPVSGEEEKVFMAAINRIAQVPLKAEDVYIRSMYLASTQYVEQDYSRFTKEAFEQIAKLVVGRSVMVGHDRQDLPIGRFFHGRVLQREGEGKDPITGLPIWWVRSWFYWLRETSGAKDLLLNIDGGIYRDVSMTWRLGKRTCSICGEEMRSAFFNDCGHEPGKEYDGKLCHIVMEEVVDVLEGSIVFAGADKGAELAGRRAQPGAAVAQPLGSGESAEEVFPGLAVMELEMELAKWQRGKGAE